MADKSTADAYIAAARAYIARGWYIHPVGSNPDNKKWFKSPIEKGWTEKHPHEDWIKKHWITPSKHIPMLGIATGRISGFFVLDVDCGGGKTGNDSLIYLQQRFGKLPDTYTVRTQSGGLHYYFQMPDDEDWYQLWNIRDVVGEKSIDIFNDKVSQGITGVLPPFLDIRGCGGQVVAPPSVTVGGGYYTLLNDAPLADPPHRLLQLIRRPVYAPVTGQPAGLMYRPAPDGTIPPKGTQAAIDREIPKLEQTPEGSRNNAANKAGFALGRYVGGGDVSYNDVKALIIAACKVNGDYQDDPQKCLKSIESGLVAGMKKPRFYGKPVLMSDSSAEPRPVTTTIPLSGKEIINEHAAEIPKGQAPIQPKRNDPDKGRITEATPAADAGSAQEEISLPPVPLSAFPEPLQKVIVDAADTFSCPIEIPTAAVLSFLSCLVGGARHLERKDSHIAHGVLWVAIVGVSGTGKSHCSKAIMQPLHQLEWYYHQDYESQMMSYGHAKTDYDLEVLAYKQAFKQGKTPQQPVEPATPLRKEIILDDTSVEGAGKSLRGNPKGLCLQRDELAGILFDLDKYSNSKGGFKARLLQGIDGASWKINRMGEGKDAYIRHAFIGMFGTIQPGIISTAFNPRSDKQSGFLPRFILIRAIQNKPHLDNNRSFSQASKDTLQRLANVLSLLDPTPWEGEGWHPDDLVPISKEASDLYLAWQNKGSTEATQVNGQESPEHTVFQKTASKVLSICLVLSLAENALGNIPLTSPITADQMKKAIRIGEWSEVHYNYCMGTLQGQEVRKEPPLLNAIRKVIRDKWVDGAGGWYVSTADLTDWVNKELGNTTATVSSRKVGRAADRLGLVPARDMVRRGWRVDKDIYMKIINCIISETSPIENDPQDDNDLQTTPSVDGHDNNNVMENDNVITADCCGSKARDVNDVNDVKGQGKNEKQGQEGGIFPEILDTESYPDFDDSLCDWSSPLITP